MVFCLTLSISTVGFGVLAFYVCLRDSNDGMAAKIGGSVITVIGCLGLIACLLTN